MRLRLSPCACVIVLIAFYAPSSSFAQARKPAAVFLGSSPDVSVYVYPESLKMIGPGVVQAWSLYDMKAPTVANNVRLHSVKSLNAVNCREQRLGILSDVYYEGRAGQGKVVWNGSVELSSVKWQPIVPQSMTELKFDFICDLVKAREKQR